MPVKRRIVKRSRRRLTGSRTQRRRLPINDKSGIDLTGELREYTPLRPLKNAVSFATNTAKYLKAKAQHLAFGTRPITRGMAVANYNARQAQSDNITNALSFKIGKPQKLGFNEKVARLTNPPKIFKRQYAWSAECDSGRKGWFGIPINSMNPNNGTLYQDIYPNFGRLTTTTNAEDPTIVKTGDNNQQKVYVDYLSEKLQMMNSSTNSITGTISLFKYKRDCEGTYVNVNAPMTPINLMMYASNGSLTQLAGTNEQTVGAGFKFNDSTNGVNYTASYDMPGSSLNPGGATAQTDLSLKVMSKQIKGFTGYFFDEIAQYEFSLKPGQQMNHYTIFNDLPYIVRQSIDMNYVRGTSYYLVVQFQAQIVGDATLTTGDNKISTGTGQLSCICEEKRVIGSFGKALGQVVMPTAPLAGIDRAAQFTINPDTGVGDIGADLDV